MPLLRECCEEMGYPFDYTSIFLGMVHYIKTGYVAVMEQEDGEIVGISGLMFAPHICDLSRVRAVEFLWHSKPSLKAEPGRRKEIMIRLLEDMESAAVQAGMPLIVSTSAGKSGRMGSYLETQGFIPSEVSYRKEI